MITSQNRPGLPVFLRATLKKLGKAWVRGYTRVGCNTKTPPIQPEMANYSFKLKEAVYKSGGAEL